MWCFVLRLWDRKIVIFCPKIPQWLLGCGGHHLGHIILHQNGTWHLSIQPSYNGKFVIVLNHPLSLFLHFSSRHFWLSNMQELELLDAAAPNSLNLNVPCMWWNINRIFPKFKCPMYVMKHKQNRGWLNVHCVGSYYSNWILFLVMFLRVPSIDSTCSSRT